MTEPVRSGLVASPPEDDGCFRLSLAQERLWFVEQMTPGTPLHHMAGSVRLDGPVDRAALAEAFASLIRRHEALRTSFASVGETTHQRIHPDAAFHLEVADLRDRRTGDASEERIRGELDTEARRPFDRSRPGLLRARLLQIGERAFVLTVVVHHLVADGWSIALLLRELAVFYGAHAAGRPCPLPELDIQYVDWAAWQREQLANGALAGALAYWEGQLAGAPGRPLLPGERAAPAGATPRGASRPIALGPELSRALRDLARREGVTLFAAIVAGFQAFLARLTGQRDLVVGSPVSGRGPAQTLGVVGLFTNLVALRVRVDPGRSFAELLRAVRGVVADAQAHQDAPFQEVVRSLGPGAPPLVSIALAWQAGLAAEVALGDVRGRAEPIPTGTAKFDLTLALDDDGDAIAGAIEYRTDRFDDGAIAALGERMIRFLGQVTAAPSVALHRHELLTRAERAAIRSWSRGEAIEIDRGATALDLVARRAAEEPAATALEADGRVMTYGELDRRAERLGRELARLGARPDSVVGLLVERTPAAIVAMLAAWKAGAAYLPLDPSLPAERLIAMMRDAGVAVVCAAEPPGDWLTGSGIAVVPAAPEATDGAIDGATDSATDGAGDPIPPVRPLLDPDHLAYVVYTSGSTGRPKGVGVSHRNLVNLVEWHCRAFRLRPADRVAQVASLGFDASVWEIWACLAAGAALVFAPADARVVPDELRDWLVARSITCSFLPTPIAEAALPLAWPAGGPLRLILTGGDRLHRPPPGGLPFALVNNYGPTEAAVVATSGLVEPTPEDPADASGAASFTAPPIPSVAPSIGRPIANARVHILDDQLQPVPAGAVGELFIGGAGVGRGYLGRPDLTAERFVPDPSGLHPGARVYRTGDLAAHDADGALHFRGRIDQQVKVRGQRIEPGEIAAALEAIPSVRRAHVLARPRGLTGEPTLAAYVVLDSTGPSDAELARLLRRRLPESMIPAVFVRVGALPLTENGKIDRAALLRIEPEPADEGNEAEPANQVSGPAAWESADEARLGRLWSELFGRPDVHPGSHFFALGGHSLLAGRLIGRLREELGRDVPLRWAFDFPVLRDLAQALSSLSSLSSGSGGAAAAPGRPGPIRLAPRERMPLSSAQERLWFLDRFTGSGAAYHVAGALRLTGGLDREALARSLAAIVARHDVLRARFDEEAGVPYQTIAPAGRFELAETDLRQPPDGRADPAAVAAELAAEAARRFDLTAPPLLRARLLHTGEHEHVLVVVLHHIAADGWSIGVLTAELAALYGAFATGRPSPLAELPLQYADYAAWQRAELAAGAMAADLAYWQGQLAGAPALAVPRAGAPGTEGTYRGGTAKTELGADLVGALRELGRSEDATLFMTLVAAVQGLLAAATGQDDILVGADVAQRGHRQVEPLIGLFVNQVVLRTHTGGDPTFRELLGRVRPVARAAWEHQGVPFDAVVELLRPARELGRNPLFQVMIVLQDEPAAPLDLPGLAADPIEIEPEGSVFDLTVAFAPRAGGAMTVSLRHAAAFGRSAAEALLADLRALLERVAADPAIRLSAIGVRRFASRAAGAPAGKRDRLRGLRGARPTPVAVSPEELVGVGRLDSARAFPVVLEPRASDVDLAAWMSRCRETVRGHAARSGAVLFRGFHVPDLAAFRRVVAASSPDLIPYGERSSPRTLMIDGVYTSTDHPADQPIVLHNEQSYTLNWPRRLWFFCLEPAASGGSTPIACCRGVLARLRRSTIERFVAREILYLRNYGGGLGLPWTEAFQTADRAAVEAHCRRAGIRLEWKGGDGLRTFQVRPAVRTHPETGASIWFNHLLFFHATSMPAALRDAIGTSLPAEDAPTNTFYGDGTAIEPEVLDEIRAAYAAETRTFAWRAGDILLVDNMLTAHGREPFSGPRRIAVAMTDPIDRAERMVEP